MSIRAHIVEDLISRAVLTRLDTPALTRVSGTPDAEAEVASLTNELSALTRRLDELTDMWTVGEIDRRTWFRARGDLEDRIEGSRTRLGRLTADSALEALIGPATSIAEIWNDPDMTLQQRHAIIRAVIDRIIIHPAEFSGPRFDPKRVEPIWRA